MSSEAREKLKSARESLDRILGRRRPTTEEELDECVLALEELKRACALFPSLTIPETAECINVMMTSFDEVIGRLKNRAKGTPNHVR